MEAELLMPAEAYGLNLEKLKKTKRKFDPAGVFHKWHRVVEEMGNDVNLGST